MSMSPEELLEQQREWGRQGAAVTAEKVRARKNLTGAQKALLRLEKSTDDLVDLTIQAAKGEGPFAGRWEEYPGEPYANGVKPKPVYLPGLSAAERAGMLKFALEQVLGKPGARREPPADPELPEEDKEGLSFGTAKPAEVDGE